MATADSAVVAAHRALGERIGAAGDSARALCRLVQGANADVPTVDVRGVALGTDLSAVTAELDALLADTSVDDAPTVEAQSAALDHKTARGTEQRRLLVELGARVVAFDKDVAAQRANVSQQQKELDGIENDSLAELRARLGELRGDVYQLQQWAASYVERNVVVTPPDIDAVETKLGELTSYVGGPLHEALDSLALAWYGEEERRDGLFFCFVLFTH